MHKPYRVPPIHDGQELLTRIRDSLRTSMNLALDGTERNLLDPNVALGIIYNECGDLLATFSEGVNAYLDEWGYEADFHSPPLDRMTNVAYRPADPASAEARAWASAMLARDIAIWSWAKAIRTSRRHKSRWYRLIRHYPAGPYRGRTTPLELSTGDKDNQS